MKELDEQIVTLIDRGTVKPLDIAKKLNAPRSTVHFRLKKLERQRVIMRYRGEVDWKKAGFPITAFVLVNVDTSLLKTTKRTQDTLLRELLQIVYVREGFITTGETDLVLKVIAKDMEHFKSILMNQIQSKVGITNTKTMIVLG